MCLGLNFNDWVCKNRSQPTSSRHLQQKSALCSSFRQAADTAHVDADKYTGWQSYACLESGFVDLNLRAAHVLTTQSVQLCHNMVHALSVMHCYRQSHARLYLTMDVFYLLHWFLQQMEVLAFTTMVISALAAIIHFASVNIIHNEGTGSVPGGHICNPGDVACEQNYNFVIVM